MEYAPHILIAVAVLGLLYFLRERASRSRHNEFHTTLKELNPPYDVSSTPDNLIHSHSITDNSCMIELDGPGDGFTCIMLSDGTTLPGFSKKDGDGSS